MENIRNIAFSGSQEELKEIGVILGLTRSQEELEKGCGCQQWMRTNSGGMMCMFCDDVDAQLAYNRKWH